MAQKSPHWAQAAEDTALLNSSHLLIALTKQYDRIGLCLAVALWSGLKWGNQSVSSLSQTEPWQAWKIPYRPKTQALSSPSSQSTGDPSGPASLTAPLHSHIPSWLTAWFLEREPWLVCINSGVTLPHLMQGKFHFQIFQIKNAFKVFIFQIKSYS